jgi:hypothetical protein
MVGCVGEYGYRTQSNEALAGAFLFAFGGLVITADRNRSIMGVRCENLFHYTLGTALALVSRASLE